MRITAALALAAALAAPGAGASTWPEWDEYAGRFVEGSGRVVDLTFGRKTTSEGQSYGLFFALVANDRQRFDAILQWTSTNLAEGRLGDRLPAWLWGRRDNGSWGVLDDGPATDAELWLAYTLLEAARVWETPRYAVIGEKLLARIEDEEVVDTRIGRLLLPGPNGFALARERYRYDPSYLPGFVLMRFATLHPEGPWRDVWDTYLRLAPRIFAAGYAPDLCVVDGRGSIAPDPERPEGGYDAIRVYLWAGMSGASSASLRELLKPFAALTARLGEPPEKIDTTSGAVINAWSPIGFSGAMLPYLKAIGDEDTLRQQRTRLQHARLKARLGGDTHYYDESLILFGKGWLDGRYRFAEDGRLEPLWHRRGT